MVWLLMGADLLIRGSVALARRARVPPVVVAATVVALGTSLPELVVSVRAALLGYPGIAIGNVVGSNIANVLLVAGSAAVIYPLTWPAGGLRRDSIMMLAITVVFVALAMLTDLGPAVGLALLVGLVVVWVLAARDASQAHRGTLATPVERVLGLPSKAWLIALFVVLGVVFLPLGARQVVDASVELAERFGVSEAVIGLSVLAFATSLPELATTVVAAYQRQTDMAVGTVIGSNVINVLAIMGVSAVVSPAAIPVPPSVRVLSLPVMLIAAVLITVFVWRERPIGRVAGVSFLAMYIGYIVLLAQVAVDAS